jgi:hypothetical protein
VAGGRGHDRDADVETTTLPYASAERLPRSPIPSPAPSPPARPRIIQESDTHIDIISRTLRNSFHSIHFIESITPDFLFTKH